MINGSGGGGGGCGHLQVLDISGFLTKSKSWKAYHKFNLIEDLKKNYFAWPKHYILINISVLICHRSRCRIT